LEWYRLIFELIDMRSFSNLWFWIVLAVMWSSASQWVIGIPFDMIVRAKRLGQQHQMDLETLARIKSTRILFIARTSGLWLVGLLFFWLSLLIILGFGYDIEFAQAVVLLFAPMALVGGLTVRTAALIEAGDDLGMALNRRLMRHRMTTQFIGMVAILVTSLFGMYQNITIGVFG
jgi:hypothetical protein